MLTDPTSVLDPPERPGTGPSWRVALAAVVVLPLVSYAALLTALALPFVAEDSRTLYLPTAANLADAGRYSVMAEPPLLPTITKMPGYSLFLAGIELVAGASPTPVRFVQFVLVGLTAVVAAGLGRRLAGRTAGLVAGAFVAAYPALAVHAMQALSETLTAFLLALHVAALATLTATVRPTTDPATTAAPDAARSLRTSPTAAVVTCVSLGALVLVRQSFVVLLPVAVLAVARGSGPRPSLRTAIRRAGAATALVGLIVGPWCLRNIVVSDAFLPFGANSGLSQLVSVRQYATPPGEDYWPRFDETVRSELAAIDAATAPPGDAPGIDLGIGGGPQREASLDARLTARARHELAELGPGRVVAGVPRRLGVLAAPASGITGLDTIERVLMAVALAGVVHIAWRRRLRATWPLWMPAAVLVGLHLVFHAEPRYTLAARPLLLVLGAVAVVEAALHLRADATERASRSLERPALGKGDR